MAWGLAVGSEAGWRTHLAFSTIPGGGLRAAVHPEKHPPPPSPPLLPHTHPPPQLRTSLPPTPAHTLPCPPSPPGYPALVALKPTDAKFSPFQSAFELQHITAFVDSIRKGGAAVLSMQVRAGASAACPTLSQLPAVTHHNTHLLPISCRRATHHPMLQFEVRIQSLGNAQAGAFNTMQRRSTR